MEGTESYVNILDKLIYMLFLYLSDLIMIESLPLRISSPDPYTRT